MKKLLTLTLSILTGIYTYAQKADNTWKGKLSVGCFYNKGNINKLDLRSDGRLEHADSLYELSFNYKIIYGEGNHIKNNEEYQGNIKYDHHPDERWSPFGILSYFRNQFKGFDARTGILAGVKYTFNPHKKNSNYSMSVALLYDIEKYTKPSNPETPAKSTEEVWRLSIRAKMKQKIGSSVYIEHTTFYKPNIKNFSEYLVESETAIVNSISKRISLKLTYDLDYDSQPPQENFAKANHYFVAGIEVYIGKVK